MSEAVVRDQGSGVSEYAGGARLGLVGRLARVKCGSPNCSHMIAEAGLCVICQDELDGLTDLHRSQVRIERRKADARAMYEVERGWRRSRPESWCAEALGTLCAVWDCAASVANQAPDWAYMLMVFAMVGFFVGAYRGFLFEWLAMWFGGK